MNVLLCKYNERVKILLSKHPEKYGKYSAIVAAYNDRFSKYAMFHALLETENGLSYMTPTPIKEINVYNQLKVIIHVVMLNLVCYLESDKLEDMEAEDPLLIDMMKSGISIYKNLNE